MKYLILLLLSFNLYASEKDYTLEFCAGKGKTEVVLSDLTRVDCLTLGYAIEVEYASKWKNSIGQAYHYALMTDKYPGVVLIINDIKECKYWNQLQRVLTVIEPHIKSWQVGLVRCE